MSESESRRKRVFVVHGRDEVARRSLFAFLRAAGLEPIEWNEAIQFTGKATPYIGEVLEAAFSRAQAVVVLMTPDDEARLREDLLKPHDPEIERSPTGQARPNVIFEAGMAFGFQPERTILVELGSLRSFSDIAGRHSVRISNSPRDRLGLIQRLQSAGCATAQNRTDWLTEGDFKLSSGELRASSDTDLNSVGDSFEGDEVVEVHYNYLLADYALFTTKNMHGSCRITWAQILFSWIGGESLSEEKLQDRIVRHAVSLGDESLQERERTAFDLSQCRIREPAFQAIILRLRTLGLIRKRKGISGVEWELTKQGEEVLLSLISKK